MIHDVGFALSNGASFKMRLDESLSSEMAILRDKWGGYLYEPEIAALFEHVLRPGDFVIDGGANSGFFSLMAAALVGPEGHVAAFEPGPEANRRLLANVLLNGVEDIVSISEKLLLDHAEYEDFYLCADGDGGNALWNPGLYPYNPKAREKTDIVVRQGIMLDEYRGDPPRLIKLDIEGAETMALKGASGLLEDGSVPFIVVEMNPFALEQMGTSMSALRLLMAFYGYQTFLLSQSGALPLLVPDETKLKLKNIINVLFSDPISIAEGWPILETGHLK